MNTPSKPTKVIIWIHNRGNYCQPGGTSPDLLYSPVAFPFAQDGHFFEITTEDKPPSQVILKGQKCDEKDQKRLQLTVLETIAKKFKINDRSNVLVRVLPPNNIPDNVELSEAVVYFKDMFLSRADCWQLGNSLLGTALYDGAVIETERRRCNIKELQNKRKEKVSSGVITSQTKITCKSHSATVYWLWQMSVEMWSYNEEGELYFDLAVNCLLSQFIQRWDMEETNHCVCILFFARTWDPATQSHKDHYKVVKMINEKKDTEQAKQRLKDHFVDFSKELNCSTPLDISNDENESVFEPSLHCFLCEENRRRQPMRRKVSNDTMCQSVGSDPTSPLNYELTLKHRSMSHYQSNSKSGAPPTARSRANSTPMYISKNAPEVVVRQNNERPHLCSAKEGNVLEAVNLALMAMEDHHIDRNLTHCGQQILILTAGSGVWRVNPKMDRLTRKRLAYTGISCDAICLGKPPTHVVPLFECFGEDLDMEPQSLYFDSPRWLGAHFISKGKEGEINLLTPQNGGPLEKWEEQLRESEQVLCPPTTENHTEVVSYTTDRKRYDERYLKDHDRTVFRRSGTTIIDSPFHITAQGLPGLVSNLNTANITTVASMSSLSHISEQPSESSFCGTSISAFFNLKIAKPVVVINPFMSLPEKATQQYEKRWIDRITSVENTGKLVLINSWSSLIEPSLMPIFSGDVLTEDKYLQKDKADTYTVIPSEDGAFKVYAKNHSALLRELTMQRIFRGYQLLKHTEVREALVEGVERYSLSIGRHFQLLWRLDDGTMKINRFDITSHPKVTNTSASSEPQRKRNEEGVYKYYIYNNILHKWEDRKVRFRQPTSLAEFIQWNLLDNVVSGNIETIKLTPSQVAQLHFRRLHFRLLPSCLRDPKISIETLHEQRCQNLQKFISEVTSKGSLFKLRESTGPSYEVDNSPVQIKINWTPRHLKIRKRKEPETKSQTAAPVPKRYPEQIRLEYVENNGRLHWVDLLYSKYYRPMCSFGFELSWVSCSGSYVLDLVNMCKRRATANGFVMVQTPCHDRPFLTHPFRSKVFIDIESRIQNIRVPILLRLLETPFDYIPDSSIITMDSLLIHRSGEAMILVVPSGLVWFNNFANFTGSITIGQNHAGLMAIYEQVNSLCERYMAVDSILANILDDVVDPKHSPTHHKKGEVSFSKDEVNIRSLI